MTASLFTAGGRVHDPARRARDIKFIHAAARELGLDRAAYEDMLFTLTRHRSCKELDFTSLARVKDHLRNCGAGRFRRPGKPRKPAPHKQALLGKIEALLADAGRPWEYGHAMARHMFALERLEFCEADQLRRIVAALAVDARRRAARS